jgi:hypothetical protein
VQGVTVGDNEPLIHGNSGPGVTGTVERASESDRRELILHYHLFKNAGTSIDELLRRNFGPRWAIQEFSASRGENAAAVREFIGNNPDLQAISSHTALLPVPQLSGADIFPIIFIRHPVDRLRSAYEFERRQQASTPGARLAKTHDFGGYLRELLRNPRHRQIRNFQTFRLSHAGAARKRSEVQRAIVTLGTLPFVGLVERFDESVARLQIRLRPLFPGFGVQPVHRNAASSRQDTLLDRLAKVEETLGKELYREICDANADDLAIYELVDSGYRDAAMQPDNDIGRIGP